MDWFCWENRTRKPSDFPMKVTGLSIFPTKPIHCQLVPKWDRHEVKNTGSEKMGPFQAISLSRLSLLTQSCSCWMESGTRLKKNHIHSYNSYKDNRRGHSDTLNDFERLHFLCQKKQCHKPPIEIDGFNPTHKTSKIGDGGSYCFTREDDDDQCFFPQCESPDSDGHNFSGSLGSISLWWPQIFVAKSP